MDCQAARGRFSEYLDARLLPDVRATLEDHLGRCEGCHGEWQLYQRVFTSVATMREEPAIRDFTQPREAPGVGDRRPIPLGFSWSRVRAAASILFLLAVSHVAVYEFARKGHGDAPTALPPLTNKREFPVEVTDPSQEVPLARVSRAASFRRRLNDHVDAMQLLARQIHYMPNGAEDHVRDIVGAQLEALRPDELYEDLRACGPELSSMAPMAKFYLDSWRKLADGLEADLAFVENGDVLANRMRRRILRSPLLDRVTPVRLMLASEPTGASWREPDRQTLLFGPAYMDRSPEVKSYLVAHEKLLKADYMDSISSFESFGRRHTGSPLLPLTRYMEAEGLRRAGLHVQALQVTSQLGFGQPSPAILRIDPLTAMWAVMRRRIDPAAIGVDGALQPVPHGYGTLLPQRQWFVEFQEFRTPSGGGGQLRIRVTPRRPNQGRRRVEH